MRAYSESVGVDSERWFTENDRIMKKVNSYFMPIVRRKCECGNRGQVYSWGEYHNGKWRTVKHFCQSCYSEVVRNKLHTYMNLHECEIELRARSGHRIPEWITL